MKDSYPIFSNPFIIANVIFKLVLFPNNSFYEISQVYDIGIRNLEFKPRVNSFRYLIFNK